ncbi:SUKH-4 family immunity protein [Actinoplanes sp. DH11]|uniref:SUKH-4 family immunity protein n=1 Tax=Actinoplanes sp. DH11 TaxID=2857011 RepID=UPI001E42ED68|nr:SUKH-4 family immunity protein [Actinoplanes sp. DH11]
MLLPDFAALAAWAGAGRVIRASELEVTTWKLPEPQKTALVSTGVPILDGVVGEVSFQAQPGRYRLASNQGVLGAVPGSGEVLQWQPDGSTRFVNSTIIQWLCSIHLVGTWLAGSEAVGRWDADVEAEEQAFAEIAAVLEHIRALDPPAIGDGSHDNHFWPATLDRWLS